MMGVHLIWINKVPYPTESISEQFLWIYDLSTVAGVSKGWNWKKLRWMIDIEMK